MLIKFLNCLRKTLTPSVADVFIYYSAKECGIYLYGWLNANYEPKNVDELLSYLQRFMKEMKLGLLNICAFNPEDGKIVLRVERGFEVETGVGGETCVFMRGMLEGLIEQIIVRNITLEETACASAGSPYCEFSATIKR
ncbi:MAG: V4R domain-containing protein [Candidatus Bathyarchaeia archaeon]